MKTIGLLAILAFVLVAFTGVAHALPVTVMNTQVNGDDVWPDDTIRLDTERGDDITIRVSLVADQALSNVEVKAFVSGYEYSDFDSISASTHTFDMEANVSYTKKLTLTLPADAESDDYKLRIVVSDRYGDEDVYNYNLKIDSVRHLLAFDDIVLSPGDIVKANSGFDVSVRLENFGNKDEKNVKVSAAIAELGLDQSAYISEIETDETEEAEGLFFKVPKCAKPGIYEMVVEAEYDRGHEKITDTVNIEVTEGESCKAPAPATQTIVAQPTAAAEPAKSSGLRTVLETVLLVLVALLVIVGLIIGFSKLRGDE
jgi:uncharacterized membrane protein